MKRLNDYISESLLLEEPINEGLVELWQTFTDTLGTIWDLSTDDIMKGIQAAVESAMWSVALFIGKVCLAYQLLKMGYNITTNYLKGLFSVEDNKAFAALLGAKHKKFIWHYIKGMHKKEHIKEILDLAKVLKDKNSKLSDEEKQKVMKQMSEKMAGLNDDSVNYIMSEIEKLTKEESIMKEIAKRYNLEKLA